MTSTLIVKDSLGCISTTRGGDISVEYPVYLTTIGSFLPRLVFDDFLQLQSILKGDMSFVGPRLALLNQYDLIKLRTSKDAHHLKPGLIGWTQVNSRDNLSIAEKVNFDPEYLKKVFYF
jgi:O-antigen biosynthesis protein WbqP